MKTRKIMAAPMEFGFSQETFNLRGEILVEQEPKPEPMPDDTQWMAFAQGLSARELIDERDLRKAGS